MPMFSALIATTLLLLGTTANAQPELAVGLGCATHGGWLGAGTSATDCATACSAKNVFQRDAPGDGNCKCCWDLLADSELFVDTANSAIYRTNAAAIAAAPAGPTAVLTGSCWYQFGVSASTCAGYQWDSSSQTAPFGTGLGCVSLS